MNHLSFARRVALPLGLLLSMTGCVRGPAVLVARGALPLQRVVIYRNGVGYFERRGAVHDDAVEFRVRQSEVGDFLATLAVMEEGGSSVRSAAFPMDEPPPAGRPAPNTPPRDDRRTVRLTLDGRDHRLAVGYMIETPIWRPSYRLVLNSNGAQVQAWGIVQNLSGEDWTNVRLSLVAGAPVSFRSELAEPMISPRPLVTDRGEVIENVPRGETEIAQDETIAAPPATEAAYGQNGAPATHRPPQAAPTTTSTTRYAAQRRNAPSRSGYGGRPMPGGGAAAPGMYDGDGIANMNAPTTPPAPPPMISPSAPRSVASLAAVAVQGGVTRYDLPNAVTVPNRSATMVLLAVRNVPGEAQYLFAPDGGVPDSAVHPFHVARFENRTGALLERGPLAIFEDGSFLGQGMLDPLPDGASATVPFALERALAVDSTRTTAIEGARLVRIVHNQITVERYRVERTTYRGRNGMDHPVRIFVRHGLSSNVRLHEPPTGTTQTDAAAMVPLNVPMRGNVQVEVQTRVPYTYVADWSDEQAAEAIRAYLRDGRPDDAVATALRTALDLRQQLEDLARDRVTIDQRLNDLRQNADETRMNLLTIQRNRSAGDLRAQLTARLAQTATEIDTLTRRLVEMDTQIGERRVRLAETTRALDVTVTTGTPAAITPTH